MIKLKEIEKNDLELLLSWRNKPIISKYFRNSKKNISLKEHIEWFENRKNRIDWIIIYRDKKIGTLHIKRLDSDSPEIGIFIGETNLWGKGIGKKVIILGIQWLINNGYKKTCAEVHKDNIYSCRIWESLGYYKEYLDDEFIMYRRNL